MSTTTTNYTGRLRAVLEQTPEGSAIAALSPNPPQADRHAALTEDERYARRLGLVCEHDDLRADCVTCWNAAEDTDFSPERAVQVLVGAGMAATLLHTGGGCMVGEVRSPRDTFVWVTDAMEYDAHTRGWMVGYYTDDESEGDGYVMAADESALREVVAEFTR